MSVESTATALSESRKRARAGRIANATALAFVAIVVVLHGAKPEIDPAWRFISEYALGAYGWLMNLAFVVFGVGHIALVMALDPATRRTWPGYIGQALLVVSGCGLALAGLFTTDSILTPPGDSTLSGQLHNVGGGMGMAMPLAVGFVTWQVLKHAGWAVAKRILVASAAVALTGAVVSAVSIGVLLSNSGGTFGPDVPVGWPNRFEIATYCVWFVAIAQTAIGAADRGSPERERTTGR